VLLKKAVVKKVVVKKAVIKKCIHAYFTVQPQIMFDHKYEDLLWVAWPCLAIGGLGNHFQNVRSCRCAPAFSTTLMSFYSGCHAGGSATVLTPFFK